MCDYRSPRGYPCDQGWVTCDQCDGKGKAKIWAPDVQDYRWRNCPACRAQGRVRCPKCNQGRPQFTTGPGGGSGCALVVLIVIAVVAWWGWHAVKQIAHNPTPSTGTDHPAPPTTTEQRSASDQHYKVTVNGVEAIGHGPSSWVSCDDTMYRAPRDATTVAVGFDNSFKPAPGVGGASVLVTNTDPPGVVNVDLHSYPNKEWSWHQGQQTGDAVVTKNGNTYRVTGSIAPAGGSVDANPVPFEFEATCP
jgi:hypothetical protein